MNQKQQKAFDFAIAGKTIFITGPAGTGKSYLLKQIIKYFTDLADINQDENNYPAVTSLTGVSCIPLKGQTLHSWAGIGLGQGSVDQLIRRIKKYGKTKNWKSTDVLIIDEVSMMDMELFEKLHMIGSILRNQPDQLFGGIQLIISGDFLQLPPVGVDQGKYFCFESPIWKQYINKENTILLSEIIRQSNNEFAQMLNRFRLGQVCQADIDLLNTRLVDKVPSMVIKPTKLYPFKKDVAEINNKELNKLIDKGAQLYQAVPTYEFRSINNDRMPRNLAERMDIIRERQIMEKQVEIYNQCKMVWKDITLSPWNGIKKYCIGAQVMLTFNLNTEAGFVNGLRGIITRFDDNANPIVLFDMDQGKQEEIVIAKMSYEHKFPFHMILVNQYPLELAWATTIHKSQSATLSKVVTDIACCFSPGQSYVSLSRVRSLEGLYLRAVDYNKIWAHPKALKYYNNLIFE